MEARVVYGPDALDVGMRMHDTEPRVISARLTRRDAWSNFSDWAMVIVDSRFDRRSAFGLAVNPLGVQRDNYFFADGRQGLSWVVVWGAVSSVEVHFGPSFARNVNHRQFVTAFEDPGAATTFGRRIVFGDLDQTTVAANLRVNWTFTPNLSLELFAQPYASAGSYSRLKEFTTPRALEFAVCGSDRGMFCRLPGVYAIHPTAAVACPAGTGNEMQGAGLHPLGHPDFTFRSLRGNAVLRWEYRPGSTLFAVWQQDRSASAAFGDLAWSRDAGDFLRQPGRHVLMLKGSYWLGRSAPTRHWLQGKVEMPILLPGHLPGHTVYRVSARP